MPDYRFQEFYDEYAPTRYPFLDTCNLIANTGQRLDFDTFFDASLYPVGNTQQLRIASIEVQSRLVTVNIANFSNTVVASTSFDPFGEVVDLTVVDSVGRPAGVLVSDTTRLQRFSSWVAGVHAFDANAAVFVPSCMIPTPARGVRGITTKDERVMTDAVLLVGGPGVVLSKVSESGIRVDIVGDPLYRRRLCTEAAGFSTPRFVQTINYCGPDQYGNITIDIGDELVDKTVLRLNQFKDGLIVSANGVVT